MVAHISRTVAASTISSWRPTRPAIPHTVPPPPEALLLWFLELEAHCHERKQAHWRRGGLPARSFQTSGRLPRRCASTGTRESTNQTCRELAIQDPDPGQAEEPCAWSRRS